MNRAIVSSLVVAWLFLAAGPQVSAQPTIYVVRHAEKLADWPGGQAGHFQPLSKKGTDRAKRLAKVFDKGTLTAVYSSLTTRTLHTAFPVSQKLNLPIQVAEACMDTAAIDAFLSEIHETYGEGDAILLVTHSNIVPYLLVNAGLPADCRKKLGISQASPGSWLLIEGYEGIWKIELAKTNGKSCGGFQRVNYKLRVRK